MPYHVDKLCQLVSFEGKTDSALVYTIRASERSAADKDTAMLIENLNQLGTIYRRKRI